MNELRILRARTRVSQWATAKAIGLTRDRYMRIENGWSDPTDAEVAALAQFFGCSEKKLGFGSARGTRKRGRKAKAAA